MSRSIKNKNSLRAGFTLLEMVVVIGVVSVMFSMLLSALQSAREGARRTACKNHLMQVAKGMIQHESQYRFLPTGGWSQDWLGTGDRSTDSAQPGGWTFTILPFIEETSLRDSVTKLLATDAQAAYQELCDTPVSLFVCPSRRSGEPVPTDTITTFRTAASGNDVTVTINEATRVDYAASGGTVGACLDGMPLDTFVEKLLPGLSGGGNKKLQIAHYPRGNSGNCQTLTLPLSSIVGSGNGKSGHLNHGDRLGPCPPAGQEPVCNLIMDLVTEPIGNLQKGDELRRKTQSQRILDYGDNGIPDLQDGIISRMSQVRAASVLDGLSNVYLLGEKYVSGEDYESGTDSGDQSILYAGYSASNVRWARFPPTQDELDVERPSAFGSAHPGTWNAAFADGSVRSMSYDIDPEVHKNLAAKSPRYDGEVLDAF